MRHCQLKDSPRSPSAPHVPLVSVQDIASPILSPCVQLVSVQDVKMIKDRSKKFKGFVYVELGTTEDVFKAVQVGRK